MAGKALNKLIELERESDAVIIAGPEETGRLSLRLFLIASEEMKKVLSITNAHTDRERRFMIADEEYGKAIVNRMAMKRTFLKRAREILTLPDASDSLTKS
jgi:hypothetical protein